MSGARPARQPMLLLALVAAGCFGGHRREYPVDWPRRLEGPAGACPDLSGVYESAPQPDPFVSTPQSLQALLIVPRKGLMGEPKREAVAAPVVRLSLEEATGWLRVMAGASTGPPLAGRRFERGLDFECSAGALEVTYPMEVGNANVCAAIARSQLALWRDAEGGLVARTSSQTTCIAGIFGALHVWEADWARFRPSPERAGPAEAAEGLEGAPRRRRTVPFEAGVAEAALVEILFAGHSWWASANPRAAGWVAVIAGPSGALYDAGASLAPPALAVGGAVGVGLYAVYELDRPGYSKGDRFLRTFAAWNVAALTTVLSDWLIGGPRPAGAPAVAVMPVDGGAALVLTAVR